MATDADNLSVRFTGDLSPLKSALEDGERRLGRFENTANSTSNRASQAMGGMSTAGVAAVRALGVAFAGLQAAKAGLTLTKETSALINLAGAASVSTQRFQELTLAARPFGVEAEQMGRALEKFAQNSAEARTKQGELYSFLRQANGGLADQLKATKSTEEALALIPSAIQRMDTVENAALLTKKAFGEGTFALAKAMREGAFEQDKLTEAVARYGGTVSDQAIAKSKSLTDASDRFFTSVKTGAKEAIGWLVQLAEGWKGVKVAAGFDGDGLFGLDTPLNTVRGVPPELMGQARPKVGPWTTSVEGAPTLKPPPDYRGVDEINKLRTSLASARQDTLGSIRLEAAQQTEQARRMLEERVLSEEQFGRARALIAATTEAKVREVRHQTAMEVKGLEAQAAEASGEHFRAIGLQYEMDLEKWKKLHEQKLINTAEFEAARDRLSAVSSANIKNRMDEEAAKIREQTAPLEQAISGSLGSAFSQVFETGKFSAASFFKSMSVNIANAVTQMLVLKPIMDSLFSGPGSLGASFASFAGLMPARGEGGGVMAGVPMMVGDRGRPEVFVPNTSGSIVPAERFNGSSSGGVSNHYTIDARGADVGVVDRIMHAMAKLERSRPDPIAQQMAYARRFPTRG